MNTNNNTNIKSGIEFPIELNEANITIREKNKDKDKDKTGTTNKLDKLIVSMTDAAISGEKNKKFEEEFWKGYDESRNLLIQHLDLGLDADVLKEAELRDNFNEYSEMQRLLYPDGRISDLERERKEEKKRDAKKRLAERENEIKEAWLETGRKLTGNLELLSLEEAREVWFQNEIEYVRKMSEAKRQKEKREEAKYLNSLSSAETPVFTALMSSTAEYEQKYGSDDLDLGYYDSVPLQDRYKWDGMSSDEDEYKEE
jgi:hypothetical protein